MSHPAWVCGLKLLHIQRFLFHQTSHPAWVCGLKLYCEGKTNVPIPSHPAWVCGLKQPERLAKETDVQVTPCVGVWIETDAPNRGCCAKCVTPCVGVWIETSIAFFAASIALSHPAWVCGLKPCQHSHSLKYLGHTLRGCVD